MPWPMVRAALASRCHLAILPMQDCLALGREHRMIVPRVANGNWAWRFWWHRVPPETPGRLRRMNEIYQRVPRREGRRAPGRSGSSPTAPAVAD